MSDDHDGVMPGGAALALLAFAAFQFASNHQLHNGLVSADAFHNAADGAIPLIGWAVIVLTRRFQWHWTRHNLDPGSAAVIYMLMIGVVVVTVRQSTHVSSLTGVVRIEGGSAALNLVVAGWMLQRHRRHQSRFTRALVIHLVMDVLVSGLAAGAAYWAYISHSLVMIGPVKVVLVLVVAGLAIHEIAEVLPAIHRQATCKDPVT